MVHVPQEGKPTKCVPRDVPYRLLQPELGTTGWKARTGLVDDGQILVKSDFDSVDEATVLMEMQPDKACILVPSTFASGIEGRFELRCDAVSHECLNGVAVVSSSVPELVPASCKVF